MASHATLKNLFLSAVVMGGLSFIASATHAQAPQKHGERDELHHRLNHDPEVIDETYPPALLELSPSHNGSRMGAIMYLANGAGPHPTILMLHGFPGNEKNLDMAQALRRIGFNVLFFHYRGSWGSEGAYNMANILADARFMISYLRNTEFATANRVDPDKISLLGHSMGGYAALKVGAEDQDLACTVAMAPAALKLNIDQLAAMNMSLDHPAFKAPQNGIGDVTASDLIKGIAADPASFDMLAGLPRFKDRPLMVVNAARDKAIDPVTRATIDQQVKASGANPLIMDTLDSDHVFSWHRGKIIYKVGSFMDQNCR